ncbi:MAG: polysaccharide deacetylase family protein, partial [Acidobacteriota bacterium]|nr:polysaccharide deacetylase family protein [Acidobacteriota bacterium]
MIGGPDARGDLGRIRNRFTASGVILLYHRVADLDSDPYLLGVSPTNFEQQLHVLRESGRPVPLGTLADPRERRVRPRRFFCITFDDAYEDTLSTAAPILGRNDVQATVFATTGSEGREREFWWDALERIFLRPGDLPARLELE